MKFDIVVGNPPYNKGSDIDFISIGYRLSRKAITMIVPAKWQTAERNQQIVSKISYGEFREKLVPHIKNLVYYMDSLDVFNEIYQTDGVTYFVMDKDIHSECIVENRSKRDSYINSKDTRSISNGITLLNKGIGVLNEIGDIVSFDIEECISPIGRYEVWVNSKLSAYDWFMAKNGRYILGYVRLIDTNSQQSYDGEAKCVYRSDNINECKSYISYINSRLVRFLLMLNISKLNNTLTNHYFRYVPKPMVKDALGNRIFSGFDHIYTDDELYDTFNISKYHRELINKIIKERVILE